MHPFHMFQPNQRLIWSWNGEDLSQFNTRVLGSQVQGASIDYNTSTFGRPTVRMYVLSLSGATNQADSCAILPIRPETIEGGAFPDNLTMYARCFVNDSERTCAPQIGVGIIGRTAPSTSQGFVVSRMSDNFAYNSIMEFDNGETATLKFGDGARSSGNAKDLHAYFMLSSYGSFHWYSVGDAVDHLRHIQHPSGAWGLYCGTGGQPSKFSVGYFFDIHLYEIM